MENNMENSTKAQTKKVQIKGRWSGSTLFECDAPSEHSSELAQRHALECAVKEDANLEDANLEGAYLEGANLRWANLEDANLEGANLRGAYLEGAYWKDDVKIYKTPLQILNLQWPVTIIDSHMEIGCQFHSLHGWQNFTDEEIARMDGRNALRFWRENKEWLLAMARANGRSFE